MGLSKVDEPKYFLRVNKEKFLVMHKSGFIQENEKMIGENFAIAQGHFYDHPEDNFLSNDLRWGFARNILFSVSGYCEKYPYADESRKYDLVCKIEAIL